MAAAKDAKTAGGGGSGEVNLSAAYAPKAAGRVSIAALGTMDMSRSIDESTSQAMIALFAARGHTELDTALMYCEGKSEQLLARRPASIAAKTAIATKAYPYLCNGLGLTEANVKAMATESLANLQVSSVDLYYLHAPDAATDIAETLRGINALHKAGRFRRFGLSNYPAWQVMLIWRMCKESGYVLPTVYQGMYNALTRDCESELLPCLRALGMSFYAYNPLAGGLMTGRHRFEDKATAEAAAADGKVAPVPASRFFGHGWSLNYQARYWKRPVFDAMDAISAALKHKFKGATAPAPTIAEAAIRWVVHHSALSGAYGDAVIIGASSVAQLTQNLDAFAAGPLPPRVVAAIEAAWDAAKGVCPKYWRIISPPAKAEPADAAAAAPATPAAAAAAVGAKPN